jgi:hypothetical protein
LTDVQKLTAKRIELFLSAGVAALLVAQQVAGKATRDALFLTSFDPRRLPFVMASGAVLSLLAVFGMSRAMSLRTPGRAVPAGLVTNAAFFGLEWLCEPLSRDGTAVAVYLHIAALGSVLISGFWSLVSERFDPNRAKRHFSRIAAGATFGGVVGGFAVDMIASRFGIRSMLLVLACTSLLAAIALTRIARTHAPKDLEDPNDNRPGSPLRLLGRTPYLRALALMSLLAAVWESLLDFALKAEASRVFSDEAALVTFFAWFYTGASLVTFLVQTLFGRLALERVGLPGTLMFLPLVVTGGGLALLVGAPFSALVAVRGSENVLSNSLYRAAYEQLFSPLAKETKRPTKTLVDVAATRLGDALGALLILALIYSWRDMPSIVVVVVAAAAALLSLFVVPRLAAGYVEALRAALRTGTIDLQEQQALDATTRRTLSEPAAALVRGQFHERIESLLPTAADPLAQRNSAGESPPYTLSELAIVSGSAESRTEPSIVHRFAALASGATNQARAALAEPLSPELVPIALHLLAHPELGHDAMNALRKVTPASTGLLVDALLDSRTPFEIRLRIPRVLRTSASRRASDGLILGLEDKRLDVRFQCAQALVHMASSDASLTPSESVVFDAVERELAEHGATWNVATHSSSHDPNRHNDDDKPHSLRELVRTRASRSLQYVLTLLSFVVDDEALHLALRGLSASDQAIRGTAIELLENVLPDPVRGSLLPILAARPRMVAPARTREEIMAELMRSHESIPIRKPVDDI